MQGFSVFAQGIPNPTPRKEKSALGRAAARPSALFSFFQAASRRLCTEDKIEDLGSALNYKRKGFNQVIEQIELGLVKRVVIGYQDRFVRFGYDWFEQFCERHGTEIIVITGETFSPEEELVRDLIAILSGTGRWRNGIGNMKQVRSPRP